MQTSVPLCGARWISYAFRVLSRSIKRFSALVGSRTKKTGATLSPVYSAVSECKWVRKIKLTLNRRRRCNFSNFLFYGDLLTGRGGLERIIDQKDEIREGSSVLSTWDARQNLRIVYRLGNLTQMCQHTIKEWKVEFKDRGSVGFILYSWWQTLSCVPFRSITIGSRLSESYAGADIVQEGR